jgi:AcrR family transcriptional regulator
VSGGLDIVEHKRPLRADARENENRVLEAAARAFKQDGVNASLRAIAKDANVGIGTLYRRFPSREHLVEAVYRNESARLCASAQELLEQMTPLDALRAWMDSFVDYILTKNGMAESLHAVLATGGELRMQTRQLLADSIAILMDAGVADGTIQASVSPHDVLMGLGGITLITAHEDQRALATRLLDLLVSGIRVPSVS